MNAAGRTKRASFMPDRGRVTRRNANTPRRANTAEETGANARTRPADATAKWRADLAHHCTATS
jgi:hypothetical protein